MLRLLAGFGTRTRTVFSMQRSAITMPIGHSKRSLVAAGLPGCSATLLDMRIDLKKRDCACPAVHDRGSRSHPNRAAVNFRLERTIFWEAAVRSGKRSTPRSGPFSMS